MIYLFILLSLTSIFGRFLNFYFSSKMHQFSVDRMDWEFFLETDNFYTGLAEEVFLSAIIAVLFPIMPFLAFGWLYSTVQDSFIAAFWPEKRSLKKFHENQCFRSLIRDFFVPYVLLGFVFSVLNLDVYAMGLVFLGINMSLLTKQIMDYY